MRCLYLAPTGELSVVDEPRLAATTERHKIDLTPRALGRQADPLAVIAGDDGFLGLVIELHVGWAGRDALRLAARALRLGRRVWLYWPQESAVECVDRDRLGSLWAHWLFITFWRALRALRRKFSRFVTVSRDEGLATAAVAAAQQLTQGASDNREHASAAHLAKLQKLIAGASPVAFSPRPTAAAPIPGVGAYLRTDYWARIESGGSYGHTCYVAKELAAVTEQFVCFMAHRYRLLDDYGLRQVVLPPPSATSSENDIVAATDYYLLAIRAAFEALRPAYIYERLVLGNYAGALLSQELGIPYIVEYNGSEISMKRSFDGNGYLYEAEYIAAEAFAFAQASMISVISAEVKAGLVARGVDADRILVNPNGADLAAYAPATAEEKARIQADAGLAPGRPVVGFTGTFGGWHGIDVLAAALPRICQRVPQAQFLLIGDGNYKHLIDKAITTHRLADRVQCAGRVPQVDGARLLKACDIYVSPHSSHMVDSKFFGSPTKIFEYMAMGGGIIASDLEQIGQILSPALVARDLEDPGVQVGDARAVLCEPGNVDDFVACVVALVERPDLWPQLGHNSRRAVEQHYSWARHVARLWPFLAGERDTAGLSDLARSPRHWPGRTASVSTPTPAELETGDQYKDEVQKQWDNDPAGSHYVKEAAPHTLEWFQEVEAYRYNEYAPWMLEVMEFSGHAGHQLLELGGGIGTDLSQFARHGALTTDLDLSTGHLKLAKENFRARGLQGRFVHHDAEVLPFEDNSFDVVYSNGVIHHTPNTRGLVREIRRVLRPGGKAIVMVYAENSLHYWRNLVWAIGVKDDALRTQSMGEIMSRSVERSDNAAARPLVKVYTPRRLRGLFEGFEDISICQRQMVAEEKPRLLSPVPLPVLERWMGWNLIIKARKPAQ